MSLHPFQAELVERVRAEYAAGARSVLMQLATGGGKTHTAAEVLRRSVARGHRALFLAHLDTLVDDTHAKLTAAGVSAGFIQAGRPSDASAPVQVCSLGTLHARGDRPQADFIVLDECHRAMAATVLEILSAYPKAHLLGLSATPQRGDGKPLGDVFERMVSGPSVRWLTSQGFLVPCDVIAPPAYEDRGLATDPLAAWRAHTPGTRAIVFGANIAHAEKVTESFRAAGVAVDLVVGDTPAAVRRGVRERMTRGELQVLVGVGVFIEGFDLPAVETVILARAFGVTGSFLQAIGRGLRPSKATGKTRCAVLDLRGSVHEIGLPDEDRKWSLEGNAVVRTEPLKALRRCAECLAIFRPAVVCPRCGSRAVSAPKVPRSLNRAEKLESLSALTQAERDGRYLRQLRAVATQRIRLPAWKVDAWAAAQFLKRFGRAPGAA